MSHRRRTVGGKCNYFGDYECKRKEREMQRERPGLLQTLEMDKTFLVQQFLDKNGDVKPEAIMNSRYQDIRKRDIKRFYAEPQIKMAVLSAKEEIARQQGRQNYL